MKQSLSSLFLLKAFLLFWPICSISSQNKNDFTWILGSIGTQPELLYGGNYINFATGDPEVTYFLLPLDMWYPDIISDEDGELAFYTNGCKINNYLHDVLPNGDGINYGALHNIYCNYPNYPLGYPYYQGHLTLPFPGREGEYAYFHIFSTNLAKPIKLLWTHVDMNANNLEGAVLKKNQVLVEDTLSASITATRHANGRDWWVVSARDTTSKYYLFLLDPQGVHGPFVKIPDDDWISGHDVALSNVFSPDGTKYVRVGGEKPPQFRMYDFDRCSGELSNPRTIDIPAPSCYATWACFSPNSRYLYVQNDVTNLYQYDTWAGDISSTAQLIDTFDGFISSYNLPLGFNNLLLGPDQRMYMGTGNGTNFMHTIHKPDLPGVACDFRQHDVVMPAIYPFYLPNFANFRLYNILGSPCDTLGVKPPIVAFWRKEQVELGMKVDFTDISYYQPVSWTWYFGDGTSSNEASPTHDYTASGFYDVCLVACNSSGMCDTLCKQIEVKLVSKVESPETKAMPVSVFPNPTSDLLNIVCLPSTDELEVRIWDLKGQEVMRSRHSFDTGITQLNLSAFPAGMYTVQLFGKGLRWSGKIVKW